MPLAEITWERAGEWAAAVSVVAVLSLMWRENLLYRIAEHLLLGLATGFLVTVTWFEFLRPKWWDPLTQSWASGDTSGVFLGLLALTLGLCWYGVYFKKTEWLMRLVLGVVIGASAGQALRNQFTQQMPVLASTFRSPLVIQDGAAQPLPSLENVIFLVAVCTVLLYFFFTFRQESPRWTLVRSVGRFWLMVGFGAYFGNTIMTRLAVFIERVWFVVNDFLLGFGR
jgi:hypothetical protein